MYQLPPSRGDGRSKRARKPLDGVFKVNKIDGRGGDGPALCRKFLKVQ
jgi:hypothetical protein